MSINFQYDVIKLINYIKDRPCLWDKSLESFRDCVKRRLAWEEVFNLLEPRYEDKSAEEKKVTEEHVVNKWSNIRDTFVRSLKHKDGKPKRKYKYYKELKFLLKYDPDVTLNSDEAGYSSMEDTSEPVLYTVIQIKDNSDANKDTCSLRYRARKDSKKKYSTDKGSDVNIAELEDASNPRVMNEDEAFFASLLPSVVKYTEDERLEFRIQVLALMKRIKETRNQINHT